jgi:pyridoxal 5'-phosphate synthase pdxS subunit
MRDEATFRVKAGLAEMLKGGVIMDVVDAEQAKIAEDAGRVAVMALERVPADIRRDGGVARMSDPAMIKGIQEAVTIPVMAKARIGHFAEAQILEALEVDYIDESEVLTPADEAHHIDKWAFRIPFVCGATNLGEALRRIGEGAAMIRSKGEAGTGDIVEAVRHLRAITGEIKRLGTLSEMELMTAAKEHGAPFDLIRGVAQDGKLPVPLFCAGGIATPADASLVMQLGAEAVFVGSGIFKSSDPATRAPRSSRPPRTSTTPSASRARARVSGRPCSRSRRASSKRVSCSPAAAGDSGAARRRPRPAGRLRRARPCPALARGARCARCARRATSKASTGS